MSSQAPKSSKPSKPPNQSPPISRSSASSLSSHLAMVELKQRILTALSKLSDRDTHQIAIEDLEKIIQSISPEAIPMLLNCLYDSSADPKPAVKKESLRLLTVVCATHSDSTSTHLTKIIAHIIRRVKDSDSGVKEACRDAIGALSAQFLKEDSSGGDNGGLGSVVALFVKPLYEAMGEQNKVVQSGAALCMAKMVECAASPPITAFQKLCPRICKLLNNPNFLAKASLLPVVSNLSQVGAIGQQSLEHLLPSIHELLGSTDWATRKAAADALSALALHSSNVITDGGAATLAVLEACRFDKIKPVRDSLTEALQLWKKLGGKTDGAAEIQNASQDGENHERAQSSEKSDLKNANSPQGARSLDKDKPEDSVPVTNSASKTKCSSISDKAAVILKKKVPALTDKELNPEFFQKLETRGSGDLPVEVVLPRRHASSSNTNDEKSESDDANAGRRSNRVENTHSDDFQRAFNKFRVSERGETASHAKLQDYDKWHEGKINGRDARTRAYNVNDQNDDISQREASGARSDFKGSWSAIQRQLLQLERQQAHLMNMLQDFMGGSHDSMITLENRVRGLERVVEDMACDLSVSSNRRGNFALGFEGSSSRNLGKYSGFSDYPGAKFGRNNDGRVSFGERFIQPEGTGSNMRGRNAGWRPDVNEARDYPAYVSRNGQMGSKRPLDGGIDNRSSRSEHESDQNGGGSRRAWDKRLGEGPSARSVWQASKDEATLEAIRVAGEDNGVTRTPNVAIPELTADDNASRERDPVWSSWTNAMDALQAGDMDTAYAEVLSTGDDILLIKLMERSGPVVDRVSNEIAIEILCAVGQFVVEPNLFDVCLCWIQELVEIVMENGGECVGIPMKVKKQVLLNFHEASSTMEPPEDWEGASPHQLLSQLASAWRIDIGQLQ
ncbi:microtubule-associated protein TORTIFOLIA1-like isoform X2 [Cucurbita moschata]|uniref:Microtubule-associated protein TORTIFOLIA1-like isoform X2 n=1 Tax=Cucurbita moschata TaxID=3662 RepID=A0A6J1FPR8_CUCMO|nr:microtubule-associated protein TORTIFOLIA1-like isoform X2 [Cucurbita moschata]